MATLTATMTAQPVANAIVGMSASADQWSLMSGRLSSFYGVFTWSIPVATWADNGATFSPARGGSALVAMTDFYHWS